MSLTIAIRFLTGLFAAARSKTDPRPEWPPHPEKVFLALAAAYFEWNRDERERLTLKWLESLPAPTIRFTDQAIANEAVPTYVPVNDEKSVSKGGTIQTVPALKRHRADRMFPRTHLPSDRDTIYFTWPADEVESAKHRSVLSLLCGRVGRFGHSTSFVQMYLADPSEVTAETQLVPDVRTPLCRLRVVAEAVDTLERLERDYDTRPFRTSRSMYWGYALPKPPPSQVATTVFSEHLSVYRLQPRRSPFRSLDVSAGPQMCDLFRRAVLSHTGKAPASISGHLPNGHRSEQPHVAFSPLPFVEQFMPHADGHLMGLAVALPRTMTADDRATLTAALDQIADELWGGQSGRGLQVGRLGEWALVPADPTSGARALDPTVWVATPSGASDWASVTPIAMDRHSAARSKRAYRDECITLIRESVRNVLSDAGIAVTVELTDVSPFHGAPSSMDFPRLSRKDGTQRRQLHALIHFDRPVVGPLMIGAGRYRGYGLCRPLKEAGR